MCSSCNTVCNKISEQNIPGVNRYFVRELLLPSLRLLQFYKQNKDYMQLPVLNYSSKNYIWIDANSKDRSVKEKKKRFSNWQAKELKKIIPKSKSFWLYFFLSTGKEISSSNQKEFEFAMNLKHESSKMLRNKD